MTAKLRAFLEDMAAWEWGEHQQRANRRVHFATNLVMAIALLSLAARVELSLPVGWGSLEPVPLALLLWVCVVAYTAVLDLLTVAALTAVLGLATGGFGLLFRFEGGWSALATLGLFVFAGLIALAAHGVFTDRQQSHMSNPPGGMFVRTLHAALLGVIPFTLFFFLDLGYRSKLRARLAQRSLRYFGVQTSSEQRNWAGTVRFRPAEVHYPKTPQEIAALVRRARAEGRRIRVLGTAYSWSALPATDDLLLCLKAMGRVSLDLSDPSRPRALVEAGADGRNLNALCAPAGLALATNVVMETVSFGGMVASGAHGSGYEAGTLSDYVEAVELVDGTGAIRRFEVGVDSDEVMAALRVHLGLMGVVYRITLRLGRNHHVLHRNGKLPVETVLAGLERAVPSHDYYDVYWWPGSDVAWVRSWDVTTRPLDPAPLQSPTDLWGQRESAWSFWLSWLQLKAYQPVRWCMAHRESTARLWSLLASHFTPTWTRVTDLLSATHYRQCIEVSSAGCVEFALPIDDGFQSVREAWSIAVELAAEFAQRGQYPLNTVVNLRFISGSDALLSPAGGNRRTCYIEALGDPAAASWPRYSAALVSAWMELPGARPHWGKEWGAVGGIGERLRAAYGTRLARFLAVRDQLGLDPDNLFVNDLMSTTFGLQPPGCAERSMPGARHGAGSQATTALRSS